MLQYKLKIVGVVQGVGFRYFVRQEATRLGLAGAVWNCPDGSV
ncbi:MAG: acylphosphatase, partial [SAR324 cluster bacterium]|nr:acylphosphatase [SAR324 cluster bacterium]